MLSYGQVFGDDKVAYVPLSAGAAAPTDAHPPAKPVEHRTPPKAAPEGKQEGSRPSSPAPAKTTGSPTDSVAKQLPHHDVDAKSTTSAGTVSIALHSIVESKYFTPVFTVIAGIIIVIMILAGAGQVGQSVPKKKAIIFLIDGLKANVFEEIAVNGMRAPNMKTTISSGNHAACVSKSDTRCAKTQSGPLLGGSYSYQSAPGLASILTGVDANVHQVYNTSFNAMLMFAQTAQYNPTFLQTAVTNGYKTAAIGGNALLTTIGSDSACSNYGVLDFECGAAALSRCMRSTSCNLVDRVPLITTSDLPDRVAETDTLAEATRLMNAGSDIIVVHINRANIAATDRTRNGTFTSASRIYAAQIYYADAIVGQILAQIKKRSANLRETWLVLGTSDHGGHDSTFGDRAGDDNLVPLWGAVYATNGAVTLAAPRLPATQMDVAPTVLEWFNLLTPAVSANMKGRVQFLCGVLSGPNCTASGFM